MNLLIAILMTAIAALLTGCASSAHEVAREAAPGGVEGSLDSLSKPNNQERLNEIVGDTTRQASHQAVIGAQEGLREINVIGPDGAINTKLLTGQGGFLSHAGVLTGGIVVAALVVLGLMIALVVLLRRARRAGARTRRKQADIRRFREVLHAARDRPWGKELEELMQDKLAPDARRGDARRGRGVGGEV